MRALIVDDSRFIRGYVRGLLEEKGIACDQAEDGKSGLAQLHYGIDFDVALIDSNMPVMNGFKMLTALRAEGFRDLKVRMITTEAEYKFIIDALDSGADEYLMKPFDEQALAEKLDMLGLAGLWPMGRHRCTRILIVDDSALMRRLLRAVVATDPSLEVAGTATDGVSALEMLDSLRPELVLLDLEMPHMDGLEMLREIRSRGYRVPVIMVSALTLRGARVTIEALASGASDYVAKPTGQMDPNQLTKRSRKIFCPKSTRLLLSNSSLPSLSVRLSRSPKS